jgi:hypothetical protein
VARTSPSCRSVGARITTTEYIVVSAGKISLVLALQADTIYTIRKRRFFSIGCCQSILKIIIGIGWLKAIDTNKCPAGRYPRHYWYRLS